AKGADVALVYFSGHGVEILGDNRLLPIDADASSLDALEKTSLPLEEVRDSVAATAKVGLIMLDACRSDPFSGSSGEGRGATSLAKDVSDKVKPGLGRIGRAENILFAFSAAPGETAADGTGQNSPFTTALTKYLGTDGLEIRSVLTLV
ncbi:MAG: caspase family protein, partial [Mesorhizobium sp.]